VEREIGIEAVLHYCCRDRNLLGMMSDLLGAAALGLRNLLVITGDPPKMGPYPDATAVFDIDAIGSRTWSTNSTTGSISETTYRAANRISIGVGVNPGAVTSRKRSVDLSGRSKPGPNTRLRSLFSIRTAADLS
jgi:homocysteine S-methyltransferase